MRLDDLEATFIGEFKIIDGRTQWREIPSIDGAQGVVFICPKCQNESILVPFASPRGAPMIPIEAFPGITHRWTFTGDSIGSLSIFPSIDLSVVSPTNPAHPGRCYFHGWVKNGGAELSTNAT